MPRFALIERRPADLSFPTTYRIAQVEIYEPKAEAPFPFPVAVPLAWVEAPANQEVTTDWTYDGTHFVAPPKPPADPAARAQLQAEQVAEQKLEHAVWKALIRVLAEREGVHPDKVRKKLIAFVKTELEVAAPADPTVEPPI